MIKISYLMRRLPHLSLEEFYPIAREVCVRVEDEIPRVVKNVRVARWGEAG